MRFPLNSVRAVLRPLAALLVAAMLTVLAQVASAQSLRVLVQSSPLAGFRHHAASALWTELQVGDALQLDREPRNPHDSQAIAVRWRGQLLGYVPRAENTALAWALDRGDPVTARISRLREHPNPRLRIEFEVFAQ
jgi:HIRAN domain